MKYSEYVPKCALAENTLAYHLIEKYHLQKVLKQLFRAPMKIELIWDWSDISFSLLWESTLFGRKSIGRMSYSQHITITSFGQEWGGVDVKMLGNL